jgi:hypothetical protein
MMGSPSHRATQVSHMREIAAAHRIPEQVQRVPGQHRTKNTHEQLHADQLERHCQPHL